MHAKFGSSECICLLVQAIQWQLATWQVGSLCPNLDQPEFISLGLICDEFSRIQIQIIGMLLQLFWDWNRYSVRLNNPLII